MHAMCTAQLERLSRRGLRICFALVRVPESFLKVCLLFEVLDLMSPQRKVILDFAE